MVGGAASVLFLAVFAVDRFTIDKHDDIGILFDGS